MTKFNYVSDYKLFQRVDIREAEELLADYNDFYIYNQSQISDLSRVIEEGEDDDKTEEYRAELAEKKARAATTYFQNLFGSKDFAESALIGLRINWYDLQQILLEEYQQKSSIQISAMNGIAPTLRKLASVLLFAENLVTKLGDDPSSEAAKNFFTALLEKIKEDDSIEIVEFHKSKKTLVKLKTPASILEFFKGGIVI